MTKRIKVMQLQAAYYIRSSDLHEAIIKSLDPEYFEVTSAYLKRKPQSGDIVSASEHQKYFNFTSKQMKGLRLIPMWKLWKYCRKEKFDIIITNGFKPLSMLLKLNKILKVPHCIGIIHCIGDFDRLFRKLEVKFLVDKHWSFVGVSSAVKNYLCQLNCGFNSTNVHTINNAIDINASLSLMLSRKAACKELGIDPEKFIFGTIGRLVNVKGHIYLLEAFKKFYKKHPESQLVIIGDGRLRKELQKYIDTNNLTHCVTMTGELYNAIRLYKAFDCYVLSSLSEGLPLVLLESMIAKVPIIATDVGGVSSAIPTGGILVPARDSDALYNAMQTLFDLSIDERIKIGETSYEFLLNNFTLETYTARYLKLIVSKINNQSLPASLIELK